MRCVSADVETSVAVVLENRVTFGTCFDLQYVLRSSVRVLPTSKLYYLSIYIVTTSLIKVIGSTSVAFSGSCGSREYSLRVYSRVEEYRAYYRRAISSCRLNYSATYQY
jgi:hypothetical protein